MNEAKSNDHQWEDKGFWTHILVFHPDLKNPCDSSVLRKTYRTPKYGQWPILEKEVVDEIIFKIPNPRDRLLLELMARGTKDRPKSC